MVIVTGIPIQSVYFNKMMTVCIFQIAVLDVDICGPSIPKVMGLEGEQVRFAV